MEIVRSEWVMDGSLDVKKSILRLLSAGARSTTRISEDLGLPQLLVSRHLDELEAEGAVEPYTGSRFGRFRYYRLTEKRGLGKLVALESNG